MKLPQKFFSFINDMACMTFLHNGKIAGVINVLFFALFFLSFQQGDILLTAGPSLNMLDGHVLDFYDHVLPYWGTMNYLPSTYFVFVLWNLPLKILGIMPPLNQFQPPFVYIMYYKLVLAVAYFISAWMIGKILTLVGFSNSKSRFGTFLWFTTPIAIFGAFIWGQYDIFTVTFVLLGVYYYLKNNNPLFIFFFAIALTFKYYSLLIFFPLLLLKEKRITTIIKYSFFYFIPIILLILPYLSSEAFHNNVFGFAAPRGILFPEIPLGPYSLKFFIMFWIAIASWAYFTNAVDRTDLFKWMNYFAGLVMFLLFGLSSYHPQWILFATPFWVMGALTSKRFDFFLWVDILMMVPIMAIMVNTGMTTTDQHIMNLGIFHRISGPVLGNSIIMRDLFVLQDTSLWYSLLSGFVITHALFKHPKFSLTDLNVIQVPRWLTQLRYLGGVSVFVLPAFFVLIYSLLSPSFSFTRKNLNSETTIPLQAGDSMSQKFVSSFEQMDKVELKIGTYGRHNISEFHIDILDDRDEILFSNSYRTKDFLDTQYNTFCVPNIPVTPGKTYEIRFSSSGTDPDNNVTIYRTSKEVDPVNDYAILNGEKQPYDLAIRVVGSNGFMKALAKKLPCDD